MDILMAYVLAKKYIDKNKSDTEQDTEEKKEDKE